MENISNELNQLLEKIKKDQKNYVYKIKGERFVTLEGMELLKELSGGIDLNKIEFIYE